MLSANLEPCKPSTPLLERIHPGAMPREPRTAATPIGVGHGHQALRYDPKWMRRAIFHVASPVRDDVLGTLVVLR